MTTARTLPMTVPAPDLPARVRIHEVGARDGLQNEKTVVPTEVKAEFIHRLAAAGLTTIEATSFVHPKWVPQLADAEDLFPRLGDLEGVGTPGPRTERARARPGHRTRCPPDRRLRVGDRDVRRPQSQPHGRRVARHVRAGRRPRQGGQGACPRLSVDVLRRPVGGARPRPPGRPGRQGADGPRLRRALPRRHHRRRHPRPCAGPALRAERGGRAHQHHRGALPRHVRPGPRQHPRRAPARSDHRGRLRGRPRRLPVREERHRKSRHRRPRVDARTASASKPGSTSTRSPPPACGSPNNWADRARPAPSEPSPTRSDPRHVPGPPADRRARGTAPHRRGVRARRGRPEDRRLLRAP